MKKSMLLALLVAFGLGLSAQSDTNARKKIEIQIEENTLSFDAPIDANMSSMIGFATQQVTRLQANHERILARIDEQEKAGNISESEAEELRDQANESFEASMERFEELMENWGESYAEKMEAWADEYEAGMDAWSAEMERSMEGDSMKMGKAPIMPPIPPIPGFEQDSGKKKIIISKDGVIIGDEEIEIEIEEDDVDAGELFERLGNRKSKSIKRTEDYLDIALGFNQQLEDGQFLIEDGPGQLDFWRSTAFNIGTGAKTRIGSPYSKFYIKYGIDFSWHNFRLNGSEVLDANADSSYFTNIGVSNVYEKNKYHIAYFNVPIMLQLDFSDAGDRDEAFTVGLGGYGGVRLMAKRELEYSTPVYEKIEEKAYDDYFTNQFRYGLMAQVGYKSFKVTASYDLNEFFRENKGPASYNMMNISLGFTL